MARIRQSHRRRSPLRRSSQVPEARNRSGSFLVEVPQLPKKEALVSILWIVLIVVLVLALLGFVGRGF
ncbi:hypothetical protein AYO48_04375 [Gaiella sp. SCGC AG-212-M14]|nr:hypothetical protein AYO48_04375 [Gaiella sp. SCGC AG-212-M14]